MTEHSGFNGGRIVVGVDGTSASAAAVSWAVEEARLRRATVHLVVAYDHERNSRALYAGRPGEPQPEEDSATRTALFTAERQAGKALPPDRLSSELADGSPAKVLIDRPSGAELLVLGSAYPEDRFASQAPVPMGPVARACLHSAACPVVVVATPRAL